MPRPRARFALPALIALVASATTIAAIGPPAGAAAPGALRGRRHRMVCPAVSVGSARCGSQVVADQSGSPLATTAPTGLSPTAMRSAYGFATDAAAGAGRTIAIVDAFDDPTAEADLGVFDQTFGLPACTTANGCFTKVNQNGGTRLPQASSDWALEISLDVQWAHAIAPGARILLVEGSSPTFADLLTAQDYANTHAQYVSDSWGGPEFSLEASLDVHFTKPGVSTFVAAGDSGLPAEYPSSSPNVVSVGGTTLAFDANGGFVAETGWSGGGGGCSAYESATATQAAFGEYPQSGCAGRRATPDVSLDADPASGASVYDSTPLQGRTGWFTIGGTSLSAPMWAARAASAGGTVDAKYVYGTAVAFRDVTSGGNTGGCRTGYDLCSGRGSWAGSSYVTNWASADTPRVLQSAAYFATTPDQLQKLGVQLLAFILALSPPAGVTPMSPPPPNAGPISYTTDWAAADSGALQSVTNQFALTPAQAQQLGAQFISYLLALGGH